MKISIRNILIALMVVAFAGSSIFAAKKSRKLPDGAYVKSAKIEILSGDFKRYKSAEALLDSLFMHYGPHAEGLHLMEQMMVDYIDKTPGIDGKTPHVLRLVAYNDSLHLCCESKDIKSKYKKKCDEYVVLSDSLKVKYWRDFYNDGIAQNKTIEEKLVELSEETDSTYWPSIQRDIDANVDSAVANMKVALILDPNNYMSYIGIGSVYEKTKNYEEALIWLKKGLVSIEDKQNLLLNIAYDHIQLNQYCEAIPYFKDFIELKPDDVNNMFNLGICYNNCKLFDSALVINQKIVLIDTAHIDAYGSIGRFFNQKVREASDSINFFREADNTDRMEHWAGIRNEMYDSSLIYFKRITEIKPDDILALEQYGTIAALRTDYESAAVAFTKLTELKPDNVDYWRYLGDCNISNKKFDEAIVCYEKVVAVNDSEVDTWERLSSLYQEKKMTKKQKEADAKIKSLK